MLRAITASGVLDAVSVRSRLIAVCRHQTGRCLFMPPFATFETTPSNDVVGVETGRSLWFAGGSAPNLPFAMLAAAGGFDAKRQFGQAFLLGPHPPARGVRACVSRIRIDCSHLATVGRDEYIERREAYFKRQ